MPEVTVDEVLVAWRDVMADEARVVANPVNYFEDSSGNAVDSLAEAQCGCFIGAHDMAAAAVGVWPNGGPAAEAFVLVARTLDPRWNRGDPFTPYLRAHGHAACAAVIDSVIAARRAEGGDDGAV